MKRSLRESVSRRALLALLPLAALACNYEADVDRDGVVTAADVTIVTGCLGADLASNCGCAAADADGDGDVDEADLAIVESWLGSTGWEVPEPDAIAPAIEIERPIDGGIAVASRMRVRGRADEALRTARVAGVVATVDPDDPQRFEAWVTLEPGLNALQVRAEDASCNAGEARVRVTFDPSLDPDPTGDGRTNILDVSLVSSCQGSDLATDCRCRRADLDRNGAVDGADLASVEEAFNGSGFPIQPRDTTPPLVSIQSPVPGATVQDSPLEVLGTVDDAAASVVVNGAPAEVTPGAPALYRAAVTLASGDNRIEVRAEDAACNVGTAALDVALAPVIVRLEMVPRMLRFAEIAGDQPFSVLGRLSDGTTRDLTAASTGTTYTVERPFVARVSADGVAAPAGAGRTRVVASNAGLEALGKVVVEPGVQLVSLRVEPGETTLRAPGAGVALRAVGVFSDGSERDLTSAEEGTIWSSAATARVAVSPEGVATAVAPGDALVAAQNELLRADARVAVVFAGGAGFVRGEVYDDTRGLPLADAIVELLSDGNGPREPPVATTSDAAGRWALPGSAGPVRVRVRRTGYTSVERTGTLPEDAAAELIDARLSPQDARESAISAALGAEAVSGDGSVRLAIPAGALGIDASVRLTAVSPQGLAALLPRGFSPIAAVDVQPSGVALAAPGTLHARAALAPDPARLFAARFDAARGIWIALDPATLTSDGRDLSVAVDALAPVVFAVADADPAAPPAAAAGFPLLGVAPPADPASLAAQGEVLPAAAPASPEARADALLAARAGEPVASGLVLRGAVRERYDLLDASRVEPRPFTQDLVLYQLPVAALEGDGDPLRAAARFPITPSRAYTVQELAAGAVEIDVVPAPASPLRGEAVGPAGGTVQDDEARSVVVPAGALAAPTPVSLETLDRAAFTALAAPGLDLLAALELDLAGASLGAPVELRLPRPADAAEGDELVVAERIRAADGVPRLRVVAFGLATGTRVVTERTRGEVTLAGVGREGSFVLLRARTPLAFATGAVTDAGGGVAPERLVASAEFADLTDASGGYLVARVAPAAGTLRARDFTSGQSAAASVAPIAAGALERLDLVLGADAPRVVAVRPADGAIDVPPAASLEIDFSEALDPASVDGSAAELFAAGTPVAAGAFLSADGRQLRVVPQAELASATLHELRIGGALRDRTGTPLEPAAPITFTVRDTAKPPQPEAGQIRARLPDDNGVVRIDGAQGTAEPLAAVSVTNLRTRETTTVLAQEDGSFRLQVAAQIGDELSLTLRTPDGRSLTVALTQLEDPDGTVAMGEAGGRFADTAGRIATVLPRALRAPGLFSFAAAPAAGVEPGPGFRVVDRFGIRAEGARFRALRSLALRELQGRFAEALAERPPFVSSESFVVPDDFLLNAVVRFEALAEDEDGARVRAALETVVVERDADGSVREAREEGRFPQLVLRAPAQSLRGGDLGAVARAATARIDFDLPAPGGVGAGAALFLARAAEVGGEGVLLVVDRLEASGAELRLRTGDAELPGAAATGAYAVIVADGPLAEVAGIAAGPASVVVLEGSAIAFATDGANGAFRLPVPAGAPYTLLFLDAASGAERERVTGVAPAEGQLADLGDPLAPPGSALEVAVEPRDGSVVDPGIEIVLRFSEPIDAASVSASSVLVRDAAGLRVPGRFAVSDDGREARFRPLRRLRFATQYRYTVTADVRARSGARLAAPVSDGFATFAPQVVATRSLTAAGGGVESVRDVAASGSLAVLATDAGLRLMDVRRPDRPFAGAAIPLPEGAAGIALLEGEALVDAGGAPVSGPFAIAVGGGAAAPGRLRIFGLADRTAPALLGSTQLSTLAGEAAPPGVPGAPGLPSAVSLLGDGRAAVAVRGIGVLDVALGRAIPENPADPGAALGARFDGDARAVGSVAESLASAGSAGLTLLDGSTLAAQATFATGGDALGVDALPAFAIDRNGDGVASEVDERVDLVAVANGADGTLQFFEAFDRARPVRIGVVRVGHGITDVALDRSERLAYVAGGVRGVVLVDLDGAFGVQPEDFDADGIDDRILGRIETAGSAERLAVDTGRGVAFVADAAQGLSVLQVVAPRAAITGLRRDPIAGARGDERSIAASRLGYTSDAALEVDVTSVTAPGSRTFLAIEETPDGGGAPLLELPEGAALWPLVAGDDSVRIALRRVSGALGSRVRIAVRDAAGADLAGTELRIAADDPAAAPAEALFVTPESAIVAAVGESADFELGAVLADGSVRNRTVAAGTAWSATPVEVATADATGVVTATGGGDALVTAAVGSLRADALVAVEAPPALVGIEIEGSVLGLRRIGASATIGVVGRFAGGGRGALGPGDGLVFTSADPGIASVDAAGVVTAAGEGETRIDVARDAFAASIAVTVEDRPAPVVDSISLDPLPAEVSGDAGRTVVTGRIQGSGALEALDVELEASGAATRTVSAVTDRSGRVGWALTGLSAPGAVSLTARITDPASGNVRSATAGFTVLAASGDREPNDSLAQASRLEADREITGSLGGADASDLFAIASDTGGSLAVAVTLPGGGDPASFFAVLRDPVTGAEIARVALDAEGRASLPIAPGPSVLALETASGAAVEYALRISVAPPPVVVASVGDASGGPGTEVVITGSGFSTDPAAITVFFGDVAGEIVSATPNELRVRVPAGAANAALRVQVGGQSIATAGAIDVGNPGAGPAPSFEPAAPGLVREDPVSGALFLANRAFVRFAPSVARAAVDALAAANAARVVGFLPTWNEYVLEIDDTAPGAIEDLVARVAGAPGVVAAMRNGVERASLAEQIDLRDGGVELTSPAPNWIPLGPWAAFQKTDLLSAIEVLRATTPFQARAPFQPVRVAVIDTGFDPVLNDYTDAAGAATVTLLDARNPANVDATGLMQPALQSVPDESGHGTGVTSLVAAVNDGVGSSGVLTSILDRTETVPFRTLAYAGEVRCGASGGCIDNVAILAALDDVRRRNQRGAASRVHVVNLSFGLAYTSLGGAYQDARGSYLLRFGALGDETLVVASAGNEGIDALHHLPSAVSAELSNVMSIGATAVVDGDGTGETFDHRAIFGNSTNPLDGFALTALCQPGLVSSSNCGDAVTLVAPGEDQIAAGSQSALAGASPFRLFGGTSGAAPIVAGAAGILQAIGDASNGNAPFAASVLRANLVRTGDDVSLVWNTSDPLRSVPVKRLNVLAAVLDALEGTPANPLFIVDQNLPDPANGTDGGIVAIDVDPETGLRRRDPDRRIALVLDGASGPRVGRNPRGAAISPLGREMYTVAEFDGGDGLLVVSTERYQPIAFVPFLDAAGAPRFIASGTPAIAVSPDARLAYVNLGDTIAIVNLVQRRLVREHTDLPAERRPVDAVRRRGELSQRLADLGALVTSGLAGGQTLLEPGIDLGLVEIRSLALAPDGRMLYLAAGSGLGSGNQPGVVIPVDVDLTRDRDPRLAGVQVDGSRYLTTGIPAAERAAQSPYLHMLPLDPDEVRAQGGSVTSVFGDEPSDVAVSYEADAAYLVHGGLDRARGDIPDPGIAYYDAMVIAGLMGATGVSLGGGLGGLQTAIIGGGIEFANAMDRGRQAYQELLGEGRTVIVAPGYTGVFVPRLSPQMGSLEWMFPSTLGFGWAPSPSDGVISQTSQADRFVSRPQQIAIDPLEYFGFGIVAYGQTGNFGFLSGLTQEFFSQSPPVNDPPGLFSGPDAPSPRLFHGLVGVTPSLLLDNHAWPLRGRFRGYVDFGGNQILSEVESPDESFLFPNDLAISVSGGFAAATHSGPGAGPSEKSVRVDFANDRGTRLALEDRGCVVDDTSAACDGVTIANGGTLRFDVGGGGVSVISLRAVRSQLAARADQVEPSPRDSTRTIPSLYARPIEGVVTGLREWVPSPGATERFHRPRGVAPYPTATIESPRFGDVVQAATPIVWRWREPGVQSVFVGFYDLDVLDADGRPTALGGELLTVPPDAARSGRLSLALRELASRVGATLVAGHRYRIIANVDDATATIARTRLEFTYRVPSPSPLVTCQSEMDFAPRCRLTSAGFEGVRSCPEVVFGRTAPMSVNLRRIPTQDQYSPPITLEKSPAIADVAFDARPASSTDEDPNFTFELPTRRDAGQRYPDEPTLDLTLRWSTQRCEDRQEPVRVRVKSNTEAAQECANEVKPEADALGAMCTFAWTDFGSFSNEMTACMRNAMPFDPAGCRLVFRPEYVHPQTRIRTQEQQCTGPAPGTPVMIRTRAGDPLVVNPTYVNFAITVQREISNGGRPERVQIVQSYRLGTCRSCDLNQPSDTRSVSTSQVTENALTSRGVCGVSQEVSQVEQVTTDLVIEWESIP